MDATQITADTSKYLFTQGVLGVACLVLGVALVYMFLLLIRQDKENDKIVAELQLKLLTLSNARVDDMRLINDKQQANDKELTTTLTILSEKITVGRERV